MKNCVWVKWARLTIQFLWLGKDRENNVRVAEARRVINYRDARNTFFDAAETVDQMIEFGYISEEGDRFWFFPPNMYEYERDDRAAIDKSTSGMIEHKSPISQRDIFCKSQPEENGNPRIGRSGSSISVVSQYHTSI